MKEMKGSVGRWQGDGREGEISGSYQIVGMQASFQGVTICFAPAVWHLGHKLDHDMHAPSRETYPMQ